MKKLIIITLLFTIFGCGPSLKERQAKFDECAKKHYQEKGAIYEKDKTKLITDYCSYKSINNDLECLIFVLKQAEDGTIKTEIDKFAFAKAEEVCGKYPKE